MPNAFANKAAMLTFPTFEAVTVPLLLDMDVRAHFRGRNHQVMPMQRQMLRLRTLAILKRHDPLYERTMHMAHDHLAGMYPATLRLILREFDSDPNAFMAFYRDVRAEAERIEHIIHRRRRAGNVMKARNPRQEHALAALKHKFKSGLAEEGDFLKYLELTAG